MKLFKKIQERGIENISQSEYSIFIDDVKGFLDGKKLVEKDWTHFYVVGDTHGYLKSAKKPAERAISDRAPIIYTGDYVDRGEKQLETLAYLLSLKRERPDKVVLLRGNHETRDINRGYGFYKEVTSKFSRALFDKIVTLYKDLPVAAVIDERFFLAHGGISKDVTHYEEIYDLQYSSKSYQEFFWNDPSEKIDYFEPNFKRGGYYLYGNKAVEEFLKTNHLEMIIRAHEVQEKGYNYYFDKKLLSLFSVPNYRGRNKGKIAYVKNEDIDLLNN